MKEIVDLNKQVNGLLSRVIDLEKNQAAVKQLMFGTTSSSNSTNTPVLSQDLSANQTNANFDRNITRLYNDIERMQNRGDDTRKRNRDRDREVDTSKSRSRERNYRAYKSSILLSGHLLPTYVYEYWKFVASVMLLLLIFICEDAITALWQKIAVRSIISILVLMFVGTIRNPMSTNTKDEESRKKLQFINELSNSINLEQNDANNSNTMIMPTLDSDEDDDTTSFVGMITERTIPTPETIPVIPNIPITKEQQTNISTPVRRMGKFSTFIMDSGCTAHVTNDPGILHEVRLSRSDREMGRIQGCVAGSAVKINGYGNLPNIGNVLIAPFIANNLLSIPQLTIDGFTIAITEKYVLLQNKFQGVR